MKASPVEENAPARLGVADARIKETQQQYVTKDICIQAETLPEVVQSVDVTLGMHLPVTTAGQSTRPATGLQQPVVKPEPQIALSDAGWQKISDARLAFSKAYDTGELDSLASQLGIPLWVLSWCAKGESVLGLYNGRLAYIYPHGMKLGNLATHKPGAHWECGNATAPWRFDRVKPTTSTIYLTDSEDACLKLVAEEIEDDSAIACVAIPGGSFSSEWLQLFSGKQVVLCFATTPSGQITATMVATKLKGTAAEILTRIATHE